MYKKKSVFITFEGIEGSGKSYQSKKLFNKIKEMRLPVIFTREPGGSEGAEKIRNLILNGKKKKFNNVTDTLLYLSARNEHYLKTLKPAIANKQIIVCDRFIDSTIAYQVIGSGVDSKLVNFVHKKIFKKFKPDITFVLKLNINKALYRVNRRKNKNRYDKLSKKFYNKVQKGFIKIANSNKKRYVLLDTTFDTKVVEKIILKKFLKFINK